MWSRNIKNGCSIHIYDINRLRVNGLTARHNVYQSHSLRIIKKRWLPPAEGVTLNNYFRREVGWPHLTECVSVCGYFHILEALIDVIRGKSFGSDDEVSAEVTTSTESSLVDCVWNVTAHGKARAEKWWGNWRMEWVNSKRHMTTERRLAWAIQTLKADVYRSPASSRVNWLPRRFKWTRPFRRKARSGFCACAITFQTQSKEGNNCSCFSPAQDCWSGWKLGRKMRRAIQPSIYPLQHVRIII